MLLLIYVVWGVFLLRAAGNPQAYAPFLNFTMRANLAHGLLMVVQAAMDFDRYWSKFLTDIPFVLILALGTTCCGPVRTANNRLQPRAIEQWRSTIRDALRTT